MTRKLYIYFAIRRMMPLIPAHQALATARECEARRLARIRWIKEVKQTQK